MADAPFNIALKTPKKLWDWLEDPGNEWRNIRFIAGMKGGAALFPPQLFTFGLRLQLSVIHISYPKLNRF
jgi:hypothetical protein